MRPAEAPVRSTTNRLRRSSPAVSAGSSSLSAARLRLKAARSSRDIWRNVPSLITAVHLQRRGDRGFPSLPTIRPLGNTGHLTLPEHRAGEVQPWLTGYL